MGVWECRRHPDGTKNQGEEGRRNGKFLYHTSLDCFFFLSIPFLNSLGLLELMLIVEDC